MRQHNLYINSKDQTDNEYFTVTLPRYLNNIKNIQISGVQIPNTLYSVNINNYLAKFDSNDVTLVVGHYTSSEFAAMVQTRLRALVSASYTVVLDSNTLKLTITNGGATMTYSYANSTANELLGFSADQSATTLISNNLINISPLSAVYIRSNALTRNRSDVLMDRKMQNIFTIIPCDVDFGEIINMQSQNSVNYSYQYDDLSISKIDLELLDQNYNRLYLNGINWSIQLNIFNDDPQYM